MKVVNNIYKIALGLNKNLYTFNKQICIMKIKMVIIFIVLILIFLEGTNILVYGPLKPPEKIYNYMGDSSKMVAYTMEDYINCHIYIPNKYLVPFKALHKLIKHGYTLTKGC